MKLKLTSILILTFISLAASAAGKSAYINPAKIMDQSPQAKNAALTLQNEFSEREQKLREMVQTINTMEQNYKKDSAIMSADQRKKVENEIIQQKRQFQFDQKTLQDDVQKRRNQLIQEVQKTISGVIRKYGSANGYDFIFTEGVAYASDSVNITDEILKELEK